MSQRTLSCRDCGDTWTEPITAGQVKQRCESCRIAWNRKYRREQRARYRAADPERIRKQLREWRRANREHVNAHQRDYYKKSPERYITASLKWQAANSEQYEAYLRSSEHHETRRQITARRRAMKRGSQVDRMTADQIAQRMSMFSGCWMCGAEWEHIDHVKPLSKGGPHILANLRPSCAKCNQRKGSKWPFVPTAKRR